MDLLTDEHVVAIAAQLEEQARSIPDGVAGLGERKHMEPGTVRALGPTFGERVEKDRKVAIPHWSHVGNVDLIVRDAPGSKTPSVVGELKWCGPGRDVLYEGIWDMFKIALATTREDHPTGYLISGAEMAMWDNSAFSDLFDTAVHDPAELCSRHLPDRKQTIAWDDLLRGGYDHHPDRVPTRIETREVGRAPIGEWELRVVQVFASVGEWLTMEGGWPGGKRPADAAHPQAEL